MKNWALGIDIGGTKVAVGLIDIHGKIKDRHELPSKTESSEEMYDSVVRAVNILQEKTAFDWKEIAGIGMGIPGKVDREKGIAVFQNNIPWHNFPVVNRIKETFPVEKIVIDNDVCMAAFSEYKQANLKQNTLFSYITISTGIASSMIDNGSFIRGAGFAGELGQMPVTSPYTGEKITLEQAVSGPAIGKVGQKLYTDELISTRDVFERYQAEDSIAIEIIEKAAQTLAEGIYLIVTLLDPHYLTVGGSVITNNPFFVVLVKKYMDVWLLPDQRHILENIVISKYSNLSGLVGAGLRVFG